MLDDSDSDIDGGSIYDSDEDIDGGSLSDSDSDEELSDNDDMITQNQELWSQIEDMIDAETVKPDRRLTSKTKDTFTIPPLQIPQAPVRRTSDVLAEHMGL